MVVTSENVAISFDGSSDVAITVPEQYYSKTNKDHRLSGLCGNLDGNPNNDMLDYKGIPRNNAKEFAEVYRDNKKCTEDLNMNKMIYNPTNNKDDVYAKAEEICSAIELDAFKPCHSVVKHEQYKLMCMQDVVLCNSTKFDDCMCSALSLYARVCNKENVVLTWRKPGLCRELIFFILSVAYV